MRRRIRTLELTPLKEARMVFLEAVKQGAGSGLAEEMVDSRLCLGRISSREVLARRSSPRFRSAAMDGIAVRAVDLQEARPDHPVHLRPGRDCQLIDTGEPIPSEYDAVVKIESVERVEGGLLVVGETTEAGRNVREEGEDFGLGDVVLEPHRRIGPEAVAGLLATGNLVVPVLRRPRCSYIPVGSELVSPEVEPQGAQVPESNSQIFSGWIRQWGGEPRVWPVVPNDVGLMREALEAAVEDADLVAVGAGTSKGREDLTAGLVREVGELLVHGVAYHPGHPIVLGLVHQKPVVGLPGYAVAGWLGLMQFVRPLLESWLGVELPPNRMVTARLANDVRGRPGTRDFVRVRLEQAGDSIIAHPLPGGAGRLSSLLRAHGLVEVAEECERLRAGDLVQITLLEG